MLGRVREIRIMSRVAHFPFRTFFVGLDFGSVSLLEYGVD